MAESFNVSPGTMELKGKLSGVSVISRKAKLVALFASALLLAFVLMATVSGWQQAGEGPPTEKKEDGTPKSVETADVSRLIQGVSDGQASAGVPPALEVDDVTGATALGKTPPGLGTTVGGKSKTAATSPRIGAIENSGPDLSGGTPPEVDRARRQREQRYQLDDSAKQAGLDAGWSGSARGAGEESAGGANPNNPMTALAGLQKRLESIKAGGSPTTELMTSLANAQREGLGQSPAVADDQNKQIRKEQFMRRAESQPDNGYLNQVKRPAIGQCELKAGMVIPAALQCGINTDLPGMLCARVRENVYDHRTGHKLLIAQGTEVIGSYDAQVAIGQERILAAWNKLIFADGSTLALQGMPGADQSGNAGFGADVNNHYIRVAAMTGMMTLFSAGFQLSQSKNQQPNASPTTSQTIANAIGQNIAQVGSAEMQKQLNVQPTLTQKPGYRFNILVTKDIVFPCPKGSY